MLSDLARGTSGYEDHANRNLAMKNALRFKGQLNNLAQW